MTDLKTVAIVANIEFTAHAHAAADLFDACKFDECCGCFDDSLLALEREKAALLSMKVMAGVPR